MLGVGCDAANTCYNVRFFREGWVGCRGVRRPILVIMLGSLGKVGLGVGCEAANTCYNARFFREGCVGCRV